MDILDALILGIVQGITEFLPISSSGHLILVEDFLGLQVENLKGFDVLVHLGTFFAILVYFRNDVWKMLTAAWRILFKKDLKNSYAKLILWIIIGTIPAVVIGFSAGDFIDSLFRNSRSVAVNLIIVALIFLLAEYLYKNCFKEKKSLKDISLYNALAIGFAQSLALVPGVSRAGATISMGLFQGIERSEAARFSFLLGLPAILGAAILTALETSGAEIAAVGGNALFVGFLTSFGAGLVSIFFLMKFLKRHSLVVFAVYRIILAIFVLAY